MRLVKQLSALGMVCGVAAVAGCAPGGSSGGGSTASGPVSTSVGSQKVTLKLASTPESGAATKKIIAAFEAKHPNVTIDYQETNYTDYNKSVNLLLASAQAPDIVLLNQVGNTVKDKLVRDLSPYVKAYKWDSVYPATELNQWRVAPNGTTLGTGALYAAPAGFSIVGLYYNKSVLAKAGITTPPTTLAGLNADLAKLKGAGQLPMQLGNKDGSASFVIQVVGQSTDGATAYAPWTFGQKGASFDTAGNRLGAQTLMDWNKSGFIPKSANGTDQQGAVANFAKGQGAFLIDGNWDAQNIGKLGDKVGFVPFPGPKVTGIGTSVAYGISSKSKHADVAAAFLDFMHSPAAAEQQLAQGFMPVNAASLKPPAGVQGSILTAWNKVNAANGLVGFNNNATATMGDALTQQTQSLLGGKTTPAKLISAIQADWTKTHG